MLKVSIFTPTHNAKFLEQIWQSIKDQPFHEWIIVYNNGARKVESLRDHRIKHFYCEDTRGWVGPLKAFACSKAEGDILLELDHDDLLGRGAVSEVIEAFRDPEIGFVYSNTVDLDDKGESPVPYSDVFGWKYRTIEIGDVKVNETVQFPPSPEAVSRIWYAPNHLRAFRKSVYDAIGGYSTEMRVLDDQDLMCRFFMVTKFRHIDRPLYIYRHTRENASFIHNREIQENVMRIYDQYIEGMVEKWSDENKLLKIEVGGRMNAKNGYTTVDLKDADIISDLNETWKLEDNSVGVIRSFDTFEHLLDSVHTMKEVRRVLVPGGWLFCQVPSTDGRGAFQDPTHVSFWNENSFLYYTDRNWAKYIDTPVRFQAVRLYTTEKDQREVCWVKAHLVNLKDGYRPPGAIHI